MNKAELVDAIAAEAGISKKQAKVALDSVTNNIGGALAKGDKVSLVGFGTFSVSKRDAREGINPRDRKRIKIPAKTVAKFKAGAGLAGKLQKAQIT